MSIICWRPGIKLLLRRAADSASEICRASGQADTGSSYPKTRLAITRRMGAHRNAGYVQEFEERETMPLRAIVLGHIRPKMSTPNTFPPLPAESARPSSDSCAHLRPPAVPMVTHENHEERWRRVLQQTMVAQLVKYLPERCAEHACIHACVHIASAWLAIQSSAREHQDEGCQADESNLEHYMLPGRAATEDPAGPPRTHPQTQRRASNGRKTSRTWPSQALRSRLLAGISFHQTQRQNSTAAASPRSVSVPLQSRP